MCTHRPSVPKPRALAEAQGGGGHLDELLGDAAVAPAVGVGVAAGDLFVACLAGVLGDVRRDLSGVQLAAVLGAGQDAGVQLLAEANVDRLAVAGITVEAGTAGGLADRVAQLLGRDCRRRARWRGPRRRRGG